METQINIKPYDDKDRDIIIRSLGDYNLSKVPQTKEEYWVRIEFKATDKVGQLVGA